MVAMHTSPMICVQPGPTVVGDGRLNAKAAKRDMYQIMEQVVVKVVSPANIETLYLLVHPVVTGNTATAVLCLVIFARVEKIHKKFPIQARLVAKPARQANTVPQTAFVTRARQVNTAPIKVKPVSIVLPGSTKMKKRRRNAKFVRAGHLAW
jgi:hypothetical protein